MILQTILEAMWNWLVANFWGIVSTAIVIVVTIIIYLFLKRYINKQVGKDKLPETTAKGLLKLLKIIVVFIILFAVLVNFVEAMTWLLGIVGVIGGAVIGFASVNTVGNMIAGLLIMTSKPFKINDYVEFQGEILKVDDIKSIYTRFITLDRVRVSIPNQMLITNPIVDLGANEVVRRRIIVTPDFRTDRKIVQAALMEAASLVPKVLKKPEPYVRITDFKDYAVEFSLYYFIKDLGAIKQIEFKLREAILDSMNKQKIDISTPDLKRDVTPPSSYDIENY